MLFKFGFGGLALGHIVGNDHHACGAAGVILDHAAARFHLADTAVGRHDAIFEIAADARGDGFAERLDDATAVGRTDIIEGKGSAKLPLAQQTFVGRTGIKPPAVDVEHRDEAFEVLGDQPEKLLLLAQGIFRMLACGDVPVRTGDAHRLALSVAQDGRARNDVQIMTVLVPQPVLHFIAVRTAGDGGGESGINLRQVVGVNQAAPQ
jgi:hypothetical protein